MSDVDSPTVDTANAAGGLPAAQQQEQPAASEERVDALARLPIEPPAGQPGSLEDRVGKRRETLEKRTTELFDVPGYQGVFQVEMRILGGKRRYAISEEHERVADEYQKGLRTAADSILKATVAIHSVLDEEGNTAVAEGVSWIRLARAANKNLGDDVKARPALIGMIGENGVIQLAEDWMKWMRTRGVKVEKDLEKDF